MILSTLQAILSSALTRLDDKLQVIRALGPERLLIDHLVAGGGDRQSLPVRSLLYLLRRTYGDDRELLEQKLVKLGAQCARFAQLYGDGPVSLLRAPARINILGEHVEYVSYLPTASLPFGSREHDMVMLYRASADDHIRGTSTLEAYPPFGFELSDGPSMAAGESVEQSWVAYL